MSKTNGIEIDFENFFEESLDILCVGDFSGYFIHVNPAFGNLLGYSREEILSLPFLDQVHPDDVARTQEEFFRLQEFGATQRFVNRYRHRDGGYRFLEWSASADHETQLMYCFARDVTHEAQERHQFTQVKDALNNGAIVAWTDEHGVITEANDRFCEISGYTREELVGQTHQIVNSDVHPDSFFKKMWKRISAGETWTGLIQNRRKSGEDYYVNSVITPIYDLEGEIRQYVAVRFDATRQITMQKAYKKSTQMLNDLCSVARIGAWELDVETGDLTWTDETFRIFELEKRDGQKPQLADGLDLYSDEARPVIENAVARAIDTGEPYSLELRAKTVNGREFWVSTNGQANIENGRIVSVHGTIQDIDQKKKTEQRYERERSMSIHNAKLASLGEMAAGVAHEINNPLAVVSGSAQLMEMFVNDPEKLKGRIADIQKSTHRITRIVDSLRKFSRSNPEQKRKSHKLNEILRESLNLTAAKARRSQTDIRIAASSDLTVFCDEVEIEQVVVNLINNAIDANMETEERWIQINARAIQDAVEICVIDSGRGIEDSTREKLFDPFFTTKRTGEGTGLGLSISKGIVDDHGGTILVDQKSPHTCIVVTLPIADTRQIGGTAQAQSVQ